MLSPRKSVGDVSTVVTPAQPVPTTPMDAGEFTGTHLSVERRSTGSPTQPGRSSYYAGRVQSPKRGRAKLKVTAFPKDLGISSEHAHYMMFTPYDIKGTIGSKGDQSFINPGEGVALPIPGAPAVTYSQGWETEQKGLMGSLVQAGLNAMNEPEGPGATGPPGRNYNSSMAGRIGNAVSKEFKAASDGVGDLGDIGKLITAKVLGGRIGTQAQGKAIFDESFAVYGGPAYRTFAFTFTLMPLSLEDADTIKNIVDFFKINSAPKQLTANLARIYELPKAFGITYHNRGKENTFMNKIGKCALTNIGVTYGGDKFNVFDGTDVPVQVDLSLAFTELQLQDSTSMAAGY